MLLRRLLTVRRRRLDASRLPVVANVAFNYFDAERFAAEHPGERPCYGELDSDDPTVRSRNLSKDTFRYFIPFERPVHDARSIRDDIVLD